MNEWVPYALYVVFAFAGLALYLLLPKRGAVHGIAGGVIALAALTGLVALLAFGLSDSSTLTFYALAVLAVGGTGRVITHTRPVYSALYFVMVVIAVAAMCLMMAAEFLAIALILIYAGAILVTYVFVIMLAQQEGAAPAYDRFSREPLLSVCAGLMTMAVVSGQAVKAVQQRQAVESAGLSDVGSTRLAAVPGLFQDVEGPPPSPNPASTGVEEGAYPALPPPTHAEEVGGLLMARYVVALELGALLLLVAMAGAVAISRKRIPAEGPEQEPVEAGASGRRVAPF